MTVIFKVSPMMLIYRHILYLPMLLLALILSGCATSEKTPPSVRLPMGLGNIRAVNDVLQLQGQPYVWGGQSPQEGFDCSGLVVYVYNRQGLRLPRTARSLAEQLPEVSIDQRQPGDLLFFNTDRPFSHVGIYVGNDQFVHAPSARTGHVLMSSLQQPYWRERFIAVRRPLRSQALSLDAIDRHYCSLG